MLLSAALIWGMAFPAQSIAADTVQPFTFVAVKSAVAAIFLGIILLIRIPLRNRNKNAAAEQEAAMGPAPYVRRAVILAGIACGLALFIGDNFQQAGISAYPPEAAASSRSGFLTATYVVMVALASIFTAKKPHPITLVAAVVCLLGMYLLCCTQGITNIYLGDLLCLGCAVGYSIHIFVVDKAAAYDGVQLSFVQFITSSIISAICAGIFETPDLNTITAAALPILYVGAISGGVGYTLQNFGQKDVPPAVAAIVLSLESVFAALGGWLLLGEVLSTRELIGCALVFAAVLLAQAPAFLPQKSKDTLQ